MGRFLYIHHFCQDRGLDITKDLIPVASAACAAVHGANRLASNSLLDTLIFAHRVVNKTLGLARSSTMYDTVEDDLDDAGNIYDTVKSRQLVCASMPELSVEALQGLMW